MHGCHQRCTPLTQIKKVEGICEKILGGIATMTVSQNGGESFLARIVHVDVRSVPSFVLAHPGFAYFTGWWGQKCLARHLGRRLLLMCHLDA